CQNRVAAFVPTPCRAAAVSRRCTRKMSGFPPRKDKFLSAVSRVGCARRNSWSLFPRRGSLTVTHDFFIPARMIALREFQGDVAADYRAECAALREHTHVNMNHEVCNREQRGDRMKKNADVPQPA